MLARIAAFEVRYQLSSPVFWVVAILFFLLTFGATTVDQINIGGSSSVYVNSPFAIMRICLIMTLFFMLVTTAFVANIIVRDDDSGFGPMVRSSRVTKFAYLFGRFIGAFGISMLAFAMVPLAIFVGSLMPWLDPETVGPNIVSAYLFAYFVLALPGVLLTASIFFAVATMTRSMMACYVAVVAFLVLYIVTLSLVQQTPEWQQIGAIIEPFGLGALAETTRYWTVDQQNSLIPALDGVLLYSRMVALSLSLFALVVAYWRFGFSTPSVSLRKQKRMNRTLEKAAKVAPQRVERLPLPRPSDAKFARFTAQLRLEMEQVFRSPAFFVLMLLGLFNGGAALFLDNEIYGTPALPVTFMQIATLRGAFDFVVLIMAIFYAGELVWRDRDRGIHEIVDATSIPNWAYLVPKVIAIAAVLAMTLIIGVIAAVVVKLVRGFPVFDLDKFALWYVLPGAVDVVLLAILAVFVQALSPNKYVGWAVMLLYVIGTITLTSLGFEHPLYLYGATGPSQLSDLNGNNLNGGLNWSLRLYWSGFALVLAVGAHLLWRRGTQPSLSHRVSLIPRKLTGTPGLLLATGLLVAISAGSIVFYNTNVLNEHRTQDDQEAQLAELERRYLQYENLPQPRITDATMAVDIYPDELRIDASGTYQLTNVTDAPIETLHVRMANPLIDVRDIDVPGATLESHDEEYRYRIYRFDTPLAPGGETELNFSTRRWQRGYRAQGNDINIVRNGTFINQFAYAPTIGMSRAGLLTDRATRRSYDLEPELRPALLENLSATDRNYVANASWMSADITVSTAADQTPLAPGRLVSDEVQGDRRVARFISDGPILGFFAILSADYETVQRQSDGVELTVFHHAEHDYNVERMLEAMDRSLTYYRANFGPYQFDHARIVEFPGYAGFAQAFAGTMPYSETLGFIADNRDPDDIDYVTYVTAHEVAHQYWAHQVISANMQGAQIWVETLAQYSAMMVLKDLYGEDRLRRFLKYDLDSYLSGRGREALEELPLNRVENQGYVHYRKGSVALYLLQHRLGEDRVNTMLADMLERYRFTGPPFVRSTVLVEGFYDLARNAQERALVRDLLERITLYDIETEEAVVTERADGRFETVLTVTVSKFYADGTGTETEADVIELFDIGLFTERPSYGAFGPENVLAMESRTLSSGSQEIRIVTAERPSYAGVDPYNLMIDRNSDDNVVSVDGD